MNLGRARRESDGVFWWLVPLGKPASRSSLQQHTSPYSFFLFSPFSSSSSFVPFNFWSCGPHAAQKYNICSISAAPFIAWITGVDYRPIPQLFHFINKLYKWILRVFTRKGEKKEEKQLGKRLRGFGADTVIGTVNRFPFGRASRTRNRCAGHFVPDAVVYYRSISPASVRYRCFFFIFISKKKQKKKREGGENRMTSWRGACCERKINRTERTRQMASSYINPLFLFSPRYIIEDGWGAEFLMNGGGRGSRCCYFLTIIAIIFLVIYLLCFSSSFSQNPVCWGRPSLTAQEAVNLSSRVKCAETKLPATTTELRRAKAVK